MRYLPRLAVGTIQPGADCDGMTWALLAALQAVADAPVFFHASCSFALCDPAPAVLGRPARHLDSWAMSRSDALCAIARATTERETALVAGAFDAARPVEVDGPASSLDTLAAWLDLPRVAIVDVAGLATRGIAGRPPCDALLLDRVADARDAAYWQTTLEALWNTPVLGWLDEAAPLRAAWKALAPGEQPDVDLCLGLARRLLPTLRIERLRALARRVPPLPVENDAWLTGSEKQRFRLAVAYDEVCAGYYPETLDLLEAAGADICDFSPLRSEAIPDQADIVYFGCGHPETQPDALARNHCLMQSLRSFAARGRRIYAEGSGAAYLCREMVLPDGSAVPMTGLLPVTARCTGPSWTAEPAEIVFGASSWLAPAHLALRGYRHGGWQFEPRGPLISYALDPRQRLDLIGRGNVIASRVLVNLAANRHLLRQFFQPYFPVAGAVRRPG
jgi:cobyrinic acid a,c-diamide synthase